MLNGRLAPGQAPHARAALTVTARASSLLWTLLCSLSLLAPHGAAQTSSDPSGSPELRFTDITDAAGITFVPLNARSPGLSAEP